MALLRKLYAGLKLHINEAKSAVCSAFGHKFLGYALWKAGRRWWHNSAMLLNNVWTIAYVDALGVSSGLS